ncbi:MAG: response regulator [Acidobacteriia bacterium]|nr:response regulator [Terriglobia bacterium]
MPPTPGTILLVDDEVSVRESVRSALQGCGYTVWDAASYDDALRTYRQHHGEIDLLITDISLPGNNGYELAAWISEMRPNIKVIFVSGQAGRELCKFYYMPETDPRLLKKPFETDELLRRVRCALGSGGSQMTTANSG